MSDFSRPQPRFPSDIPPPEPRASASGYAPPHEPRASASGFPAPAPWRFVHRSQIALHNRLSEIENLLARAHKATRSVRLQVFERNNLLDVIRRLEDLRALFLWISSPSAPWPKRLSLFELRKIVREAEQTAAQPSTVNRQRTTAP